MKKEFVFECVFTLVGDDYDIEVLFNPIFTKDGAYDDAANNELLNRHVKAYIKQKFQPKDTSFVKHLKEFDFTPCEDDVRGKYHVITHLKLEDVVIASLAALFAKKGV